MLKTLITPESCKSEDSKFSGTVEMKPPFVEERWSYLEECGLDSEQSESELDKKDIVKLIITKMVKHLDKHVLSVAIVHKESGYKYESLDDLKSDPEAVGIVIELCSLLMKGFRPSKNL